MLDAWQGGQGLPASECPNTFKHTWFNCAGESAGHATHPPRRGALLHRGDYMCVSGVKR